MRDIRRVLVIDDSTAICLVVEALLRKCGFENVETVQNGKAALDRVRLSAFDFILCDWEMEPMNGLQVLDRLRRHPKTRAIPFILMSAKKEPRWVVEALEAGANCLIAKPFDAAKLRAKIDQFCGVSASDAPGQTVEKSH
jgi:two-component system chemotaxis response regulator CheY